MLSVLGMTAANSISPELQQNNKDQSLPFFSCCSLGSDQFLHPTKKLQGLIFGSAYHLQPTVMSGWSKGLLSEQFWLRQNGTLFSPYREQEVLDGMIYTHAEQMAKSTAPVRNLYYTRNFNTISVGNCACSELYIIWSTANNHCKASTKPSR